MGKSESKPEFDKPWRNFNLDEKSVLIQRLKEYTPRNPDVRSIKILVAGQVGAGKSSFINSVHNVVEERITSDAPVNSSAGHSTSFTKTLKGYHIRSGKVTLPIVFMDTMGLEAKEWNGSQPCDIINAVSGQVKDGYTFDQVHPLTKEDQHYISEPKLSDQAFCLVYVIAADTVQFTNEEHFNKLKIIRSRISEKRLPQVIVMTKVDEACPLVKKDLNKIYTSKKIKEKMEICSQEVGVPMNFIFPVKNYHEEIDTEDAVDVLILKALDQIVQLANDRLPDSSSSSSENTCGCWGCGCHVLFSLWPCCSKCETLEGSAPHSETASLCST